LDIPAISWKGAIANMTTKKFQALVVDVVDGKPQAAFKELALADLPDGDVLIKVHYSSLNYKDGLAVTGRGKILRRFPIVPGIDLAGVVEESASPRFKPGDSVIVTGFEIGEKYWGGYTQYARVKSDWLVPLPSSLTLLEAMSIGTAGLTAMLSAMALEQFGVDKEREVVVTGAAGGVGSFAVALLSRLGYRVTASTGRKETHEYLKELGATTIIDRAELAAEGRPLESQRWGGAVDTVGGSTLAGILRSLAHNGTVAACGLAGGSELHTTVFPFILRGVKLVGIDSNYCPLETRITAWNRLADLVPKDVLKRITRVHPLGDITRLSEEILAGRIQGRVVIDVNA
jgi:acrylyl-CoA reductase (NADPH)